MGAICADSGELYSCGCNGEGQLGYDSGSEERVDVPTRIALPTEMTCIKMLSAGVYHSACLTGLMLFCYIPTYICFDVLSCVKHQQLYFKWIQSFSGCISLVL